MHGMNLSAVLSVGLVLNCTRTMNNELSTRLWPLKGRQELSWHLTLAQYKFQYNDFLNVVFGPAVSELLKRERYQAPTSGLLNKNLSKAL